VTAHLLDMYSTKLKKHDSRKYLPDENVLSEDDEFLSHETGLYSLHREIYPGGIANPWAELLYIRF
jgi:hypothetical protein